MKILIKHGLKENLPALAAGEMAFTTDSHELFIGDGVENILIGMSLSELSELLDSLLGA